MPTIEVPSMACLAAMQPCSKARDILLNQITLLIGWHYPMDDGTIVQRIKDRCQNRELRELLLSPALLQETVEAHRHTGEGTNVTTRELLISQINLVIGWEYPLNSDIIIKEILDASDNEQLREFVKNPQILYTAAENFPVEEYYKKKDAKRRMKKDCDEELHVKLKDVIDTEVEAHALTATAHKAKAPLMGIPTRGAHYGSDACQTCGAADEEQLFYCCRYGEFGECEECAGKNALGCIHDYRRLAPAPAEPHDEERTITFTKPWGRKSWLVNFEGKYENDRPPHVELVSQKELDDGVRDSIYHTMVSGTQFGLKDLHRNGNTIAWRVEGLMRENGRTPAHFTVHYGNRSLHDFLPAKETIAPEPHLNFQDFADADRPERSGEKQKIKKDNRIIKRKQQTREVTFCPRPEQGKHTPVYEKAMTVRRGGDDEEEAEDSTFEIVSYEAVSAMVTKKLEQHEKQAKLQLKALNKLKQQQQKNNLLPPRVDNKGILNREPTDWRQIKLLPRRQRCRPSLDGGCSPTANSRSQGPEHKRRKQQRVQTG